MTFAVASKTKAVRIMTTPSLLSFLGFSATPEQANALTTIERFLASSDHFLIVRGAAGTGKTSIMSAVTRYLMENSIIPVPLGPTGRAAKNLGRKTGVPAKTMHSCFYTPKTDVDEAIVRLERRANDCPTQQVFIADESSMVSDRLDNSGDFVTSRSLLADFVDFVRQGHTQNKIIFVGDTYQLPPIGYDTSEDSPALMAAYLRQRYGLRGDTIDLKQVMRQGEGSAILTVANVLRQNMEAKRLVAPHSMGQAYYKPAHAIQLYLERFAQGQHDRVAILSLSNAYRNDCNAQIRTKLGLTDNLAVNDTVVLTQTHIGQKYVANGEVGVVKTLDSRIHRVAGLTFVEAEITFKDEHDVAFSIVSLVMLDALKDALDRDQRKALLPLKCVVTVLFRKVKILETVCI